MKNLVNIKTTVALSIAAMLVACGGGSGGSSSSSSPTSLNLNAAYSSMLKNGRSALYTLAGDCTGYSSQTYLPAYAKKNYATPAVDVWAVEKVQFDTLSTASQSSKLCTEIFNSNNGNIEDDFFDPTNQTIVNPGGSGRYWKVYSNQAPLPTSVSAGSSGTLYTWKNYEGASSTDGDPVLTGSVTYSVAADSATSLLVTITETGYEFSSNKLSYTVSDTYRLNADNTLTALSFSIRATENSPIGLAGSVSGTATPAVTLNPQAARVASLTSGTTYRYNVFDGNGNQCSPVETITVTPLSSTAGTTSRGIAYAKSNLSTFNPSTLSGGGRCSSFNFPLTENAYYDVNYALVQQTTNNSGGSTSTSVATSSLPLPNSATIGANGLMYNFSRYGSSSDPSSTGNMIYYVGAITPTKLAYFEVQTKNYIYESRVARQIFVSSAENDSSLTPIYGYVNEGSEMYLKPTN